MKSSESKWKTPTSVWHRMKEVVRDMRKNSTIAEEKLWQELRNKKLRGIKFRRQHPIGRYAVDFYSRELSLIVEVDGSIHDLRTEEDKIRQEFLEESGYKVKRFTNEEVLNSIEIVLKKILDDP